MAILIGFPLWIFSCKSLITPTLEYKTEKNNHALVKGSNCKWLNAICKFYLKNYVVEHIYSCISQSPKKRNSKPNIDPTYRDCHTSQKDSQQTKCISQINWFSCANFKYELAKKDTPNNVSKPKTRKAIHCKWQCLISISTNQVIVSLSNEKYLRSRTKRENNSR